MDTTDILMEREQTYGRYEIVSNISQEIKRVMRESPNYRIMPNFARESMDMIANKIARILNGSYYNEDSWRDISGYAQLVIMTLEDLHNDNQPNIT